MANDLIRQKSNKKFTPFVRENCNIQKSKFIINREERERERERKGEGERDAK